jgi:Transcriptional regulator
MDELKKNIIDTASTMFLEYGLRSISIDDICNKMQISKKTFYTVFEQKEELIETVLLFHRENEIKKCYDLMSNINAIESLIILVKEMRKHINETPPTLFFDLQKYYPALFKKIENEQKEIMQRGITNNLERGIEEGYYRNDLNVDLTTIFFSVQIPAAFKTLKDSKKYSKKQLLDFFIDLLLNLIVSEKGKLYLKENYN